MFTYLLYLIFPQHLKTFKDCANPVILIIVYIRIKDAKPQVLAYHVQIKSSKELYGTRPNFCKIQTHKRFKGTLFIRTKPNIQILGVIPFMKLQNKT